MFCTEKHVNFCPCCVFFRADPRPQSDTIQGLLIQPLLRIFHQGTVPSLHVHFWEMITTLRRHRIPTNPVQRELKHFPISFQLSNILLSCAASAPTHLIEFHSVFPAFLSPQSPIKALKASEPGRWKTDRV